MKWTLCEPNNIILSLPAGRPSEEGLRAVLLLRLLLTGKIGIWVFGTRSDLICTVLRNISLEECRAMLKSYS